MIAAWIVFSVVTGCAFTAAAIAADRLASIGQRPRRFIWFTAMVVTTCWPAIALIRTALFPVRDLSGAGRIPVSVAHRLSAIIASAPTWDVSPYLSALIVLAWGALTGFLVARLVFAVRHIRRCQRTWRPVEVDGMTVHIATDAGPSVIGLRSMRVVLPEWVLGMSPAHRELILRHEAEHRTARDPYLLLIATLLTALFPWNLALWFQARRMRVAIEIDCDTRVLHAHPRWREYARLLVTIAQRQARETKALAPALSEPTSNLERRITAMRTKPTFSPFRTVYLTFAAIAAVAFACAVDNPQSPDRSNPIQPSASQDLPQGPELTPFTIQIRSAQPVKLTQSTYFEFQVEKPAMPRQTLRLRYPASMRGSGVAGEVLAQYVVNETGRVEMTSFQALKSSGPDFTKAVMAALPTFRFDAAVAGGKSVKQVVQQAFHFTAPPGA
jgi:beta-lactamase regulating signal transducer with metallopeptidase domain